MVDESLRASWREFWRLVRSDWWSRMNGLCILLSLAASVFTATWKDVPAFVAWMFFGIAALLFWPVIFGAFHRIRIERDAAFAVRDKAKDRGVKAGWAAAVDSFLFELRPYLGATFHADHEDRYRSLIVDGRILVEKWFNDREVRRFDDQVRPGPNRETGRSKEVSNLQTTVRALDAFLRSLLAVYHSA